jgi:hypothetical protein
MIYADNVLQKAMEQELRTLEDIAHTRSKGKTEWRDHSTMFHMEGVRNWKEGCVDVSPAYYARGQVSTQCSYRESTC